jgi:hypothetical protein
LHRREVLKLLAFGSGVPALGSPLFAACREIHAELGAAPALKILSTHQDATVAAMAELIIPQTDTPGAKDVRVDEFVDRIVSDWYSDEDRQRFLAGLADVDARAQRLFARDFAGAPVDQQLTILRILGEELAEASAALANAPRGYRGEAPQPQNNFYLMFRELTLTSYFTSEAGFTQQLHEEIIPGRYDGCVPLPAAGPANSA